MTIKLPKGVLNGQEAKILFDFAKKNNFALPAVNVTNTNTINASLETAKKVNSPIIIQLSYGGAQFFAGKSIDNTKHIASIYGALVAAKHIHTLGKLYNISIILHTDHAAAKLLGWVDGLIEKGEQFYNDTKRPLFTSHMLDLSEEPLEENLKTSCMYMQRLAKIDMMLEVEVGPTGGEEDGIDNTSIDSTKLYSQPNEIYMAYKELSKYNDAFTIAAAFGNVHGVYKPGNVKLEPKILFHSQEYIKQHIAGDTSNPASFVFHGGSGSMASEIQESIKYGVVKMNLDTDLQWAFFDGVKDYYNNNKDFLQKQIGNPQSDAGPNKKYYDPRVWLRKAEESFSKRLEQSFEELNAKNIHTKI
ncbi:MAG: class II fructose-bisphosphate aldolase [Solitalea-like symbiont of Acarus siro]